MTLGPDARDLLATAEGGDDPSEADAARVRAKLAARLAMAAATTSIAAGTAAKTATAGASGVAAASTGAVASTGTKLLIAVALIGSTAATTVAVKSMQSTPDAPAPSTTTAAPKVPSAPLVSPVPVPVPVPVPDPTPADRDLVPIPVSALPSAKAPSDPPRPRVATQPTAPSSPPVEPPSTAQSALAPPPTPADSIAEEAAILRRAQSALARGDGAGALAQTREHEHRFPSGALAEERNAVRVLALCAAGNVEAARAAASAFVVASPRSPLAAQVRASCADRSAASP